MSVAPEATTTDAFERAIASLDDTSDLARPALILAADEYPGLNFQRYLDKLDDLADEALQSVVIGAKTDCEAARRLAQFLAEKQGFHGNSQTYDDPRNSFLSDVIDRRVGIPISLSLVLIEVGRRLGVPLVGIGFPGHFLVGCGPHRRDEYLLLDPFCDGKVVDWNECELRIQAMGMQFDPVAHLSPVTNRQFFTRVLNNLKAVYIKRHDVDRAIRTVSRLTAIDSEAAKDYCTLAAEFAGEGEIEGARRCLRAYLEASDGGAQADDARQFLSYLLERRALRN